MSRCAHTRDEIEIHRRGGQFAIDGAGEVVSAFDDSKSVQSSSRHENMIESKMNS